jgi:hypothetical protein
MRHRFAALCVLLFAFALARPLSAQCTANASSCVSCHETQGVRPVLADPHAWHVDHGFGDLCAACHGGVPGAQAKDEAHAGMTPPLADPARTCGACHRNAAARAERYAALTSASAPPSAAPSASASSATIPASSAGGPGPSAPSGPQRADLVLASVAIGLAGALGLVALHARGRLSALRPSAILARLRAPLWSPYAAGALLGVVVALSESLLGRTIAVSGAFDRLAAYPVHALFPRNAYYAQIVPPAITWQVWMVLGLLLGAFLAARLSRSVRARWLPDEGWTERFGDARWKRFAIAFTGAALVQIGAGIAGGCTSGLAISGGALLAPGAFVFMAGMFAGGIPTAWLWHRRTPRERRRP